MEQLVGAAAMIGAGLAAACAAIGASLGNGNVIARTLEGIARQPEAKGDLRGTMLIGVGLIEAIPVVAIVVAFILLGKA